MKGILNLHEPKVFINSIDDKIEEMKKQIKDIDPEILFKGFLTEVFGNRKGSQGIADSLEDEHFIIETLRAYAVEGGFGIKEFLIYSSKQTLEGENVDKEYLERQFKKGYYNYVSKVMNVENKEFTSSFFVRKLRYNPSMLNDGMFVNSKLWENFSKKGIVEYYKEFYNKYSDIETDADLQDQLERDRLSIDSEKLLENFSYTILNIISRDKYPEISVTYKELAEPFSFTNF